MIQPGSELAHYEIVSALGKGGMGEVWRARDQKLGREVAIKTLPEEFAQDEERLARFEREAKLLASLNHPNIATIHGLEEDNGTRFLVLELVEGDTLADRLKRGAIPVEESLKLALQIAEALEAAHEKGVIHRDLKPANIKVTPDGKVKVLDFGLAKAFAGGGSEANLSQSPTISMTATQQGVILGTAAYMSPEQARGREVDSRTDVWAFGCVLFEMLTGRSTFAGDDVSLTLAWVLERQPDSSALPPNLHPRIGELLERCLEKEARNRYHAVADARVDIQKVLADPASVAVWYLKPPEPRPISRFSHVLPEDQQFTNTGRPLVAVSPDGSNIVYVANFQLYLRSMDELEAHPIPGTDGTLTNPVFSPDGQSVGYWSGGQLKKIAISGGAPVTLCDAGNPYGASWGEDDIVVYGQAEGIMKVSANGGTPEPLVETGPGEQVHGPQILPDGKSVLFTLTTGTGASRWDEEAQIVVQSLDSGQRTILVQGGSDARYVPTGHLVYVLNDVLLGVTFDLTSLEVSGGPVPIVQGVAGVANASAPTGTGHFSFSTDGSLVYLGGSGTLGTVRGKAGFASNRILVLADRNGGVERLNMQPAQYLSPRLSPDSAWLAVQTMEADGSHIWVYDLVGDTQIRQLTQAGEGNNIRPIWTPDSRRITFASDREGTMSIFSQPADGGAGADRLTTAEEGTEHWPNSWSPDGRTLSFTQFQGSRSLWTLSPDTETGPGLFYDVPESDQHSSLFSPDGEWLAYTSGEAGGNQIYVQPFPKGQRFKVTQEGGAFPLWSADGQEMFYRRSFTTGSTGGILMSVDIAIDPGFTFSNEQALQLQGFLIFPTYRDYDITPDGERFLMVFPAEQTGSGEAARPQINIVLNWFEELKERVPVP